MFLIFDTETTGLPRDKNAPLTDFDNWPRVVQIAWQLHDQQGALISSGNHIVKPDGFTIPFNAAKVHGITTDFALKNGKPIQEVLELFNQAINQTEYIIGHNIEFDRNILGAEYLRNNVDTNFLNKPQLDTCTEVTANFCQIPGGRGGRFKYPTLEELYKKLFEEGFSGAHNAMADVEATSRSFFELMRIGVQTEDSHLLDHDFFINFRAANPNQIQKLGLEIESNVATEETADAITQQTTKAEIDTSEASTQIKHRFSHLRNHSTFTILYSTIEIKGLIQQALTEKMPAIGLTDTGNMMGAFNFVSLVNSHNKKELKKVKEGVKEQAQLLKAVLGSELYICRDHTNKSIKDNGYLSPLFAKNKDGYQNLSRLSSISYIDGFYYVPRIDKEVLLQYKDNLIATTGSLSGEVPSTLLNIGEQQAEEALLWWKEHFQDDFYIEINRHGLEEEEHLNTWLLAMAKKHQIKYFAANDNYYLKKEDAEVQDLLVCIKENAHQSDPIGQGRGYRPGLPNNEYYFKSEQEMHRLFADIPEAIDTIDEIINKIEPFSLERDIVLPEFEIPEEFVDPEDANDHGKRGENNYLRHLAYEGAKKIYGTLNEEVITRLDFELDVIASTGYPGYFLIVQDLIREARKMGVWVGPGRGSVAGSLVAYCTEITKIDPLQYGLLFERFLNPERISMPDIDIDFDDEGRAKVIEYVTNKYGKNKVAQIITYGTLGAKSAIRDIGRVLAMDQKQVNYLASTTKNIKFGDFVKFTPKKLNDTYRPEQIEAGETLLAKAKEDTLEGKIIKNAMAVEGLVRNTGIHACGFVITPTDLREIVPVTISKESPLWSIQYDNYVAERAGLLKIDFLGLKTLTLMKDTIEIIEKRHGRRIDPDKIPLDDLKTFELFQAGETVGVFQYESPGMQKYLRDLKPTHFNDLIAMNALFRPGPKAYIPDYIRRKHGIDPIIYDLEDMREFLEETYGITVYQEQVMQLSQKLAGFTRGQADTLRKAMGKKIQDLIAEMYTQFEEGTKAKGYPQKVVEKVWSDWKAFADYGFNKSHSTCYAYIAFQTAYLKANYPAEYMASVLSNNSNDIKQVTFFMEECRRMNLKVLGPDVNESEYRFTVNDKGEIRFGLGAIKNMGEAAANSILEERRTNGIFRTAFDFLKRSSFKSLNRRNIEALVTSGAFDSMPGIHRAQFFYQEPNESQTFLEKAIRFAIQHQEEQSSSQFNLFGETLELDKIEPQFPQCEPWSKLKELNMELESIGFYISAHPLDNFKIAIKYLTNANIQFIKERLSEITGHKLSFAAQVTNVEHLTSQQGNAYGRFEVEDFFGVMDLVVFGETYLKVKHLLDIGVFVLVHGAIQPRYKDAEKNEFKVLDVRLLDTAVEESNKTVFLSLDVTAADEEDLEVLSDIILEHRSGKHHYELLLKNHELKLQCSLKPRSGKVNAATLLPALDKLDWVTYDFK